MNCVKNSSEVNVAIEKLRPELKTLKSKLFEKLGELVYNEKLIHPNEHPFVMNFKYQTAVNKFYHLIKEIQELEG